jgi:hypothetical protein
VDWKSVETKSIFVLSKKKERIEGHVVLNVRVGTVASKKENAVQILHTLLSGLSILAIQFFMRILNTGKGKARFQREVTKW